MKSCVDYLELISAYADGELTESEAKMVKEHLEACENCSALLELYREISVAAIEGCVPAPDSLCEDVMALVETEGQTFSLVADNEKRRKIIRTALKRYVPLAACLALVLLTLPRLMDIYRSDDLLRRNNYLASEVDLATDLARGGGVPDMFSAPGAIAPAPMAPAGAPPIAENWNMREEGEASQLDDDAIDFTSAPEPDATAADVPEEGPTDAFFPSTQTDGGEPRDSTIAEPPMAGTSIVPEGITPALEPQAQPYYMIIEIIGDYPELLADYDLMTIEGDLREFYLLPRDVAHSLLDELRGQAGVFISSMDIRGEYALVVYTSGGE